MRESVTYRELVAESEARGEVRGREQERRRVARQMLTMGMTPEQVTNVLGLSPEQVRQVRAEMSE
jgi:predicted transposase/invertase (TIGR01784 family)